MAEHVILGRLRGKAPPRDEVLDRLAALNPRFRLHWLPVGPDGAPYWAIMERCPDPAWQAVGRYRLDRYRQHAAATLNPDAVTPAILYECEQIMDGDHLVALYPDDRFGTDWMFQDLAQAEQAARARDAAVRAAQHERTRRDIAAELDANPDFCAAIDAMAREDYRYFLRGRHSVVVPAALT